MLAGCPSNRAGADETAGATSSGSGNATALSPKQLVIICSATESDPWARELLALAGDEMGFDPWAKPTTAGHLDVYGPYETKWQDVDLKVTIAMAGFTTVAELLPQQAIGEEARAWLASVGADVLWLDGDPAQLHVGAQMPDGPPVLFTGVVNDANLYYDGGAQACGVYRRHSLAGVLGQVWRLDPERFKDPTQPRRYALITDDSPISISRASRYAKLEVALPEGQTWLATPAAKNWAELQRTVNDLQSKADALIFCGVGEDNCDASFLSEMPPVELLAGNRLPAVVLGPSRIDQCGAAVLSIKPSAAITEALARLGKLLAGREAASLGVVEPQDMALYQAAAAETTPLLNDGAVHPPAGS
jgi:hypothetical protein